MTEELYSLLVPLDGERLIVPRACVAEVVRYSQLEHEPGTEDYMLGNLMWNGRSLPVASFEGSMGKDIPSVTGRTRIIIFVASGGALSNGYFGVLTQGFPQLVRVNRDVLRFESDDDWPEEAPVHCRVKMINEFPLIPNLDRLESLLAATQA
ncbi:MAG: chemotaxis protein CheW [Pseudomonadota bacterium]